MSEEDRQILSVSALNRQARELLEQQLTRVWLQGEISNLTHSSAGHVYFSLKDAQAQVRCALFKAQAQRYGTLLRNNGQQVVIHARVSLYEPRGEYQLIALSVEDSGEGALRLAFEQLRAKLEAEGLFAPERKRPLPRFPKRIGVVTSPTGAALRDVLSVLQRRFPGLPVTLYPTMVQGDEAPDTIVRALAMAARHKACDVLLLVRGGGAMEDLAAFNSELVARAIDRSPVPVISGVGHETDFTIADWVADWRAPTPSVAAERASPERGEVLGQLLALQRRLTQPLMRQLQQQQQRLKHLQHRLQLAQPGRRIQMQAQRLDELEQRLLRPLQQRLAQDRRRLEHLHHRLQQCHPARQLPIQAQWLHELQQRLQRALRSQLQLKQQRLRLASRTLHTLSPLATLERGYAIARSEDGRVLQAPLNAGERVEILLAHGKMWCRVEK